MVRKVALIFGLLFLFMQNVTLSQEKKPDYEVMDYSNPQEYYIKSIDIQGVKYLDEEILANLSGLRQGDRITIPGEQITKAINNLWSQGLFSDVKIFAKEVQVDSISLGIYLQEQPRLSGFDIIGVRNREEKDIKEELKLKQGSQVNRNVINNIRETIKEYFYDKKYLNTEIQVTRVDDTTRSNRVNLQIRVNKNEKVKIKDITFSGNTVFDDGELRRTMEHTHKKNWNIFQGSKFIPEKYEEDKEKIIDKYMENGYRDARIVDDTVYSVSEDRIKIDIQIHEGKQYFFDDIEWTGNTVYPTEMLMQRLKIDEGDPFDMSLLNERINAAEDAVGNLYLDNGYLFFNANPVITQIEDDSVDIEVRIQEGKQAQLNRVIIEGNTKTNEHVIRRELRTKPGDLFNRSAIQRSQRELAQLGHFDPEQMGIEPININQSRGEVDLNYSVVEKPNDQLEISGGWGAGMFVGTIGITFNNFSARRLFEKDAWKPVPSGDGQTLSVRARTNGSYYQNYSISFQEPWLGGKKPNNFSVSAYRSIQNTAGRFGRFFRGASTDESYFKITGGSVGLRQRLEWPDDYFILSNSFSYERYNLKDWQRRGFIIENGIANNFSFSTTFGRNSVSQPIYPRSGSKFMLTLKITPPYSLFTDINYKTASQAVKYNWIEYHKWKYKGEWYQRLLGDLVLAVNTEFGYLGYYNEDIGHSPFGTFDVGGDGISGYNLYGRETIALRGYENSSLTPINKEGKKAGNIYERNYMELRYPVSLKRQATIYVLGFIEAGNAWQNTEELDPLSLKRSAGIGLRAFLPMFGLLGIDWGYGFDEIPGRPDANGGQFHFLIGQQF
ncbi:MAG: outer membrane protein assembly factor BamA [Bacteroidales bacterium]|nr:outer membrane protein assembly factor BamA [Bacteroidales bacterium]